MFYFQTLTKILKYFNALIIKTYYQSGSLKSYTVNFFKYFVYQNLFLNNLV